MTKKTYEKTVKLWLKLIREDKTDTLDFQNVEAFLHTCMGMEKYGRSSLPLCNASQLHIESFRTKAARLINEYHNNFVDRFIGEV